MNKNKYLMFFQDIDYNDRVISAHIISNYLEIFQKQLPESILHFIKEKAVAFNNIEMYSMLPNDIYTEIDFNVLKNDLENRMKTEIISLKNKTITDNDTLSVIEELELRLKLHKDIDSLKISAKILEYINIINKD